MPPTKRRPRKRAGAARAVSANQRASENGTASGVISSIQYRCPNCDGYRTGVADYKADREGVDRWFYHCHKCAGQGVPSRDYLTALAGALGVTHPALQYRGPNACGLHELCVETEAEPLPSSAAVAGYASRLHGGAPEALRWLIEERGLSASVIHRMRLGWDGNRLIFPMYDHAGELVACKWRYPRAGHKLRSWAGKGRPWPLYPEPQGGWVLLCAGELDALCARSCGLPASSVTRGAGNWRADWTEALRGRRVVVCFDNNERSVARDRVQALREAGISASRLDLRRLGITAPKADLSDYLVGGGSVRSLRRVLRGAR